MEEMQIQNRNDADIPNQDANIEQEHTTEMDEVYIQNEKDVETQLDAMQMQKYYWTRCKHKIGIQDRNARYVCVNVEEMLLQNRHEADIPNKDANTESECRVKMEGMHIWNTKDADIQMEEMKT